MANAGCGLLRAVIAGALGVVGLGWCALPAAAQQPPAATTQASAKLPLAGAVPVKGLAFEGNTRFSSERLTREVADILGRNGGKLTLDDLEEIRQKLTLLYINAGYINSGAILPDQTIDKEKGIVRYQIVEGRLNKIDVTGKTRLRRGYVEDRIWRDKSEPLDALRLRNNLEMLRQNPNIKSVNAELKPGERPGESVLDVAVAENTPWLVGIQFDNNRSPSVGAERFSFIASDTNLLGLSDNLSLRWGLTKGQLDHAEFAELDDINIAYSAPISPYDTMLQVSFENSDSPVVEEPFAQLNIRSRTQGFSVGLRQPLYRSVNTEFAVSVALSRRDNKTFLAGEPFSFSPGTVNGESTVTAVRIGQEFLTRTQEYALALRSTFSIGVDALQSTIQKDGIPDSQYWAWLGQAQYVRRLPRDWQLILRGTAQLTDQALLPIEQFSLGGVDTVRGYRENQLVRDEALVATAELRIPIVRKNDRSVLDLAVFFDAGWAKNNDIPDNTTLPDQFISSAGLGVLWNPVHNFSMTVYWGIPFKHFDQNADNLQDMGIHFNLVATLP
ncbi:MAG: outer membrane protein family [Phycisphaerales bacterium]|nr:outer membrane protein family [Phycisphaerales bacterium]